ncbi:unnamed protein product, partial [marine sediment metagenome]
LRKFTIKKISNYINYHIGKTLTYLDWVRKGKPVPPPNFIKENTIKKYAKRFKPRVFVETGTNYGEMINVVKYLFSRVISVELNRELYEKSKERFKDYPNIEIFNGDSSDILPKILPQIKEPILFWLDAHYSGDVTAQGQKETPIIEELEAIFNYYTKKSIILIDDARLFIGKNNYPSIEELKNFIKKNNSELRFKIENDVIVIHCK